MGYDGNKGCYRMCVAVSEVNVFKFCVVNVHEAFWSVPVNISIIN